MMIIQAIIFAAGNATRMRPLTDSLPKPMIQLAGDTLLAHIIRHLDTEGVTKIIINGHHAVDELVNYMPALQAQFPHIDFTLSVENELLETGGGAVQALQYLNTSEPLYMINGDAYWVNPPQSRTLQDLAKTWNNEIMDCLLLLQKSKDMGDYNLDNARAIRSKQKTGTHAFAGVRICHPRCIQAHTLHKFSFLDIMDDCEQRDRLFGLNHQGQWYHLSTPADIMTTEQAIKS